MKLLGDKILVRITKDNRESIYSKEIVMDNGTKSKLFLTISAEQMDERHNSLFVQTGVVEMVSDEVKGVEVGDIAILDYSLCNSMDNFFKSDENGDLYWLNATTSYHKQTEIAYQTRRSHRDQIIHKRGEIDMISMLLGIIRKDVLIARRPYVFLEHLPTTLIITTLMGIEYGQKQKTLTRKVLAVDEETTKRFSIKNGDMVIVNDPDIFMITYDRKKIDCINDEDCLGVKLS